MLSVGIDLERMREARAAGCFEAVDHGGALAAIHRTVNDAHPRLGEPVADRTRREVGAVVDKNDGKRKLAHIRHNFGEPRGLVVDGNDDDRTKARLHAGFKCGRAGPDAGAAVRCAAAAGPSGIVP